MSEPQQRTHWQWEGYVAWEADQPVRYELVDDKDYAMGGGTAAHDRIANALWVELPLKLRHSPISILTTRWARSHWTRLAISPRQPLPEAL